MDFPFVSDYEIEQQFRAFLDKLGLTPAPYETLRFDGHLYRFDIDGFKRGNQYGAYVVFTNGKRPAGFAQSWQSGVKSDWAFQFNNLSDEQQGFLNSEDFKKQEQALRWKREKALAQKQAEAAERSRIIWDALHEEQGNHSYLVKKHVYPYGIRTDGERIAVPLRDIDGNINSLQWILPAGTKRFQADAPTKGLFWSVGLDTLTSQRFQVLHNSQHYQHSQLCKNWNRILLGEGFATMAKIHELTGLPVVAALSCYGLRNVAEALHKRFPQCEIICTADNDHITAKRLNRNPGLDCANELKRSGLVADVIFPHFNDDEDGSDWDDYAILHGDDHTAHTLNEAIRQALIPQHIKDILARTTIFNAQELRDKVFPPIKWAVEGFLPEGLSILAGGPKIGKSILALHLATGVAIGGCVLGKINVAKGQVLYLALEDTPRRLQERILGGELAGEDNVSLLNLDIITEIPRQDIGGTDFIDWWLRTHEYSRLVIIDTLQMFRKLLTGKGSMYSEDYEAISSIKRLADCYHIAILILHHLKKGMEGDWLSEISGSQGIAGAADTIFSLKRERNSALATLHRTGRDVEERDFIMKLDGYGWTLQDDAEAFTMPEWKRQILDFLKSDPSVSPIQLSQALGLNINTARQNLSRLMKEGTIRKTGFGTYGLPEE